LWVKEEPKTLIEIWFALPHHRKKFLEILDPGEPGSIVGA
jgi:hypothetical protein